MLLAYSAAVTQTHIPNYVEVRPVGATNDDGIDSAFSHIERVDAAAASYGRQRASCHSATGPKVDERTRGNLARKPGLPLPHGSSKGAVFPPSASSVSPSARNIGVVGFSSAALGKGDCEGEGEGTGAGASSAQVAKACCTAGSC
jgi:hypothetical protein